MKTSSIIALAAAGAARLASAHTTVYAIWVNDVDQGLGNSASGYIRSPPSNSPITDVTSASMTCNTNNAATAKTIDVAGGDKITFEWHHNDRSAGDDIIDPSHKGPVMVYIAPTESNGAGNVWVKLAEDGYDGSWGVDRLIAAKGKHSITLPNLKAGTYLLRPEIIALHEGDRANGAQFYMECVQIKVTSAGTTALPAGVAIPGTYTATDPGVLFDLYNGFTSYPIPGPKVWDGASSGSTPAPASSAKPASSAPAAASSKPVVVAPASSTKKAATSVAAVTSKAAVASSYLTFPTSVPAPPASVIKTTMVTVIKTKTATAGAGKPTATAAAPAGGAVKQYYQCGGNNYTGSTTCAAGLTCKVWNEWYSQCL